MAASLHGWAAMKNVLVALLALHLIACSATSIDRAGDGGPDTSGGGGGTGATGGSGGGVGTCGPGDQDCLCPGGTFTCQNNRLTCVCPQQCTSAASCGQDAICYFHDGNCGRQLAGYCLPRADAAKWPCASKAVCGCDRNLYDNTCAALAAGVSPNVASTSDCAAAPIPCSDRASAASCYPTQYCDVWNSGGSITESCAAFQGTCAQPSCDCISYNAQTCSCALLPSGIVRLTCTI